jgi:hypothetical protein
LSILNTELVAYASASLPVDDVSTTGGAIDATRRPVFTQLTSNAVIAAVSSAADTRTLTVTGRDATGAVVTDSLVLTGTTEKVGIVTFERIINAELNGTSGTLTVTLKQGSGGATIATIPINETGPCSFFRNSASSTSTLVRYEKFFWKNTNATLTLNAAAITLTADPATKITLGVGSTLNDTVSVANRLTAPSGVTFVGVNTAQSVPTGVVPAGSAVPVWMKQTLAANDAALRQTFVTQLSGTSI